MTSGVVIAFMDKFIKDSNVIESISNPKAAFR